MSHPSSTSSPSAPSTLKILTLNVWGLAYISKARQFRIRYIAERLAEGDWDIVALQEIWVESDDWRFVSARCAERLPYTKFFYSGAFGSGLAILSRFPIFATHTQPYTLNGLPLNVGQGDWFVGKAAGSISIDLGDGILVDVFNTHTVAAGGEDGPEMLRAHRLMQAWELSKLVQNSAEKGRHAIAVGDFNSTPPSLPIAILRNLGSLSDAFLSTHPSLPPNAVTLPGQAALGSTTSPDPHLAIAKLGVTCDSPLNSWTEGKPLDGRARAAAGKRLDYIFYRGPYSADSEGQDPAARYTNHGRLKPVDCKVCFTERVPGSDMSCTDHFGVEATFEILPRSIGQATKDTALNTLADRDLTSTLNSAVSALGAYMHHCSKTQRSHLLGFCGCVTAALTLAIATPFLGYRGYNLFAAGAIVLAIAAGWGGTTLLYSGVIWGEWEKRALRTAIESMELDLSHLSQRQSLNRPNGQSREDGSPTRVRRTSRDQRSHGPAAEAESLI
ncbi:DNase I-like protein [Microstroma glucosiphilum]|uniref:DNase I-like protein n=1 Tax=Pseudomicrostroma glucosiphilum TaxID=1684307 RepID=A0A316U5H7_9BASI|nr:DNase I-like protein [Pseudomicrostroma glucosiphilum]PWN20094.1 DNase I-like protein [Pseudomicrostroma glucosiphilum]